MNKIKKVSVLFLLIFLILQMFGCAVHPPVPQEVSSEDEAVAMGFSAGDYNGKMRVGDYMWLPVNLKIDYQYVIKWYSSNPEVATVDSNGRVDAVSPGTVTITATANKASLDYEITVSKAKNTTLSNSTAFMVDMSTIQQNVSGLESLSNPYAILVNTATGCATVYTYNNSGIYSKAVRAMVCSLPKDSESFLGSYSISQKEKWHYSDDGKYYQYYCGVSGDNDFSLSSAPYSAQSASELIAKEYNKLGTACTNSGLWFSADDAKWIYDNCAEGTLVKLTYSDNKSQDPLGVPVPMRINEIAEHQGWDPTDHNGNNPYKRIVPVFEGIEDAYVEYNTTFDAYEGVSVLDTGSNSFEEGIKVDGKVICSRKGMYVITYTYTDVLGRTGRADRKVYVLSHKDFEEINATTQN